MHCKKNSVGPGDALGPEEFLDARRSIEAAPAALLGPAVREVGFVVHGAVVDVDGTADSSSAFNYILYDAKDY